MIALFKTNALGMQFLAELVISQAGFKQILLINLLGSIIQGVQLMNCIDTDNVHVCLIKIPKI
jgi:hypothetical protein